jgi:hypothetical protein
MSRRSLRWLVVPAVVLPLAWLLVVSLGRSVPRVGDPAPDFTLRTIDGGSFTFSSVGRKKKVLAAWASW